MLGLIKILLLLISKEVYDTGVAFDLCTTRFDGLYCKEHSNWQLEIQLTEQAWFPIAF